MLAVPYLLGYWFRVLSPIGWGYVEKVISFRRNTKWYLYIKYRAFSLLLSPSPETPAGLSSFTPNKRESFLFTISVHGVGSYLRSLCPERGTLSTHNGSRKKREKYVAPKMS